MLELTAQWRARKGWSTFPLEVPDRGHTDYMQALSMQNRVLGLFGAVEAGVALWYLTNGHWVNGILYLVGVTFLITVYVRRQRKPKGPDGGRRY
jgi:hypothetical protein